MSDEQTPQGSTHAQVDDPTNNLKAEFNRKIQNLQESLAAANAENRQILQALQAHLTNQQSSQSEIQSQDEMDLLDPEGQKKFFSKIEKLIEDRTSRAIGQFEDRTITQSQLYSEYPELTDPNSNFHKEVQQMYSQLQNPTTEALQSLVYQVAAKQGLKPKSFRTEDDFSLGASSGASSKMDNNKKKKDGEVDDIMLTWLHEFERAGAPIKADDPKVLEKLKEHAKRKVWTKTSGSPEFKRQGE